MSLGLSCMANFLFWVFRIGCWSFELLTKNLCLISVLISLTVLGAWWCRSMRTAANSRHQWKPLDRYQKQDALSCSLRCSSRGRVESDSITFSLPDLWRGSGKSWLWLWAAPPGSVESQQQHVLWREQSEVGPDGPKLPSADCGSLRSSPAAPPALRLWEDLSGEVERMGVTAEALARRFHTLSIPDFHWVQIQNWIRMRLQM